MVTRNDPEQLEGAQTDPTLQFAPGMQCTKLATFASLVGTLLAGCAGLHSEPDKPRVAVLEIRGAKSAELQNTILDILGEDYAIVYEDEYRDIARELKAKRMKRRHVKKVARRLGVEAVIYGKVVKRSRRKYTLSLRVREGKSGRLVKKLHIPVRKRRKLSKKNARKLERKLMAIMEDVAPPPLQVVDDDDDDDEETAVARNDTRRAKRKRSRKRARKQKRKPRPKKTQDEIDNEKYGVTLEDDFEIIDTVRDDGQFVDDEVPPGWK